MSGNMERDDLLGAVQYMVSILTPEQLDRAKAAVR